MTNKLQPEDYKPIIEVEDYLYEGNIIYGTRDDEEPDSWLLEDGDIFTTKELKEEYKVRFLTCNELLEKGKEEERKRLMNITLNKKCKVCDKEINILEGSIIDYKPYHFKCYREEGIELMRKKLVNKIKKWDVEPCCHGIMQRDLLKELGEEDWIKY